MTKKGGTGGLILGLKGLKPVFKLCHYPSHLRQHHPSKLLHQNRQVPPN